MYHYFDIDIAKQYGLNEAILLNNIAFWVFKNRANNQNFYEGRHWTYNSIKAYSELFPYMSESTIRRTLNNLAGSDLILIGNFGSSTLNKTNYYTLTDLGEMTISNRTEGISHNEQMEEAKMTSSLFNKNTDSTDNKHTDIDKHISRVVSPEIAEKEAMFEEFWKAYPQCFRKTNKKGSRVKFLAIKNLKEIFPDIMRSLELQKRSEQWREKDGKYIPMPTTWINEERWNIQDTRTERQVAADNILQDRIGDFLN